MKEFLNSLFNANLTGPDIIFLYLLLLFFVTIMGGLIYDKFKDENEIDLF